MNKPFAIAATLFFVLAAGIIMPACTKQNISPAGVTVGTIEGDTFTMNNEGMFFVYKKQP